MKTNLPFVNAELLGWSIEPVKRYIPLNSLMVTILDFCYSYISQYWLFHDTDNFTKKKYTVVFVSCTTIFILQENNVEAVLMGRFCHWYQEWIPIC